MTRQLFLHVGASKTGTSSLQAGLVASKDALSAAGVGLPFALRQAKVRRLLRPLGWAIAAGFPNPVDAAGLDAAVSRLRSFAEPTLLVTCEDLAELDDERVAALAGRLQADGDLALHVLVTARDWSRQLPSEFQQQLKRRMTTDYESYLGQVREHDGPDAAQFRARQDVAATCARWAAHVPAEAVHVLPIGSDHDAIFREVAGLVGYPAEVVTVPGRQVNQSFGVVEAEVLRRVNVSLGSRLSDVANEYNPAVRKVLAKGVLSRAGQMRLTLPPEHLEWVRAESRRQVDALVALGVDVRGDLETLVPGEASVAPLPEIDEAEVARVAVETFANFAVQSFTMQRSAARDAGAEDDA